MKEKTILSKLIALVLSIILVFSLVGCGNNSNQSPNDNGSGQTDTIPQNPDDGGNTNPDDGGNTNPDDGGNTNPDDGGNANPDDGGNANPDDSGVESPDDPIIENNVKIWSADISDKILQDRSYNGLQKQAYDITAVKGEIEGGQIILTPEKSVNKYHITLQDLKDDKGNILSKNCFKVYNQKYINVTAISDGSSPTTSTGVGWYPDALLPMENAVLYHENRINAGKNQGITIDCIVPREQKSGNYSGTFSIKIDGIIHNIDAYVNVVDYTLTDKVTAKSCFMMNRGYMEKGGDSTIAMYEKYYDFMLEHRVSAFNIPCMIDEIDSYIQAVVKYTRDSRCSSIAIPQFTQYNGVVGDMDIDMDRTTSYLNALAEYSAENNINLYEKIYFHYGTIIDEPDQFNLEDRALRVSQNVNKLKKDLVDRIKNGTLKNSQGESLTGEIVEKMISSIQKAPHIVTSKYTDKLHDNGNGVLNFCPQFDKIDFQKLQQKGNEYWWYGCIGPQNPYPSYHIDDQLLTSRILSWMQKDYGVKGNLYWETCFWFNYDNSTDKRTPLDDLYSHPMRYPGCNGDGFLLYPGQPYGIDGPVGSVRLSSIRDGLEEYEILADIERGYNKVGYNANSILQQLYKEMFSNVRVNCNSNVFMRNRKIVYQLAELMQKYDTYIIENTNIGNERKFTIKSKADEIKVNGQKLESNKIENGYTIYDITCSGDNAFGRLKVQATKDGRISELSYYLGGKTLVLINATQEQADKMRIAKGELKYLSNSTRPELPGSAFELVMNENRMLTLYESNDLKKLGENTDSIMFHIFNKSAQDVKVAITVKGSKKDIYEQLGTFTLKPGINHPEINGLTAFNWKAMGDITAMKFTFEGNEPATMIMSTVYMKEA